MLQHFLFKHFIYNFYVIYKGVNKQERKSNYNTEFKQWNIERLMNCTDQKLNKIITNCKLKQGKIQDSFQKYDLIHSFHFFMYVYVQGLWTGTVVCFGNLFVGYTFKLQNIAS